MVERCGFYVEGDKIIQQNIMFMWELGFDRRAKFEYIKRAISILDAYDCGRVAEVTTASPIYKTRSLSPYFINVSGTEKTVEDFYQEDIKPRFGYVPGLMEYLYLTNLTKDNIQAALEYECYIDIFHNPMKRSGCTQALALAILRWAIVNNKADILENETKFLEWYKTMPLEVRY